MRITLPLILLAAGLLAGCQTTGTPEPQIRTGEGMIDPATGALRPEFNDGSFALSFVVEEKTGRALSNSDRREMDAALDRALSDPPQAKPVAWTSALSGNAGEVDLADWRLDRRAGELCGTIRHAERLERPLSGAVTLCRASIDKAWRIDEVIWDAPERVTRKSPPKDRPKRETVVKVIEKESGSGGEPNYGVGSKPQQGPQTAPAPDCTIAPNTGAQTLGDCLAPG